MLQVVEELQMATEKELDFIEEMNNILKFSKNNENVKFIKSPLEYIVNTVVINFSYGIYFWD